MQECSLHHEICQSVRRFNHLFVKIPYFLIYYLLKNVNFLFFIFFSIDLLYLAHVIIKLVD